MKKILKMVATTLSMLMIVLAVTLTSFLWTSAAVSPIQPFGGPIVYAMYCTCAIGNIWLIIGSPTPAVVTYVPYKSIPYAYYQFYREGPNSAGNYLVGPQPCLMWYGPICAPLYDEGVITQVGTSLSPISLPL